MLDLQLRLKRKKSRKFSNFVSLLSRRVPLLPPLAEKLGQAYREFGLRGEKLLLAVSGGADSTALLLGTAQVAQALDLELAVGTVDHGLRPESSGEVEQVRALAVSLGLSFHCRALALTDGPSLEGRARQARYQALEEIRIEAGCDWIATAHTASDQAETLLMRLLRGTALGGASGIRPRRGRLIRPLLTCSRREVERFLAELGATFAVDPMNGDVRFARARIRAQLIPVVESTGGIEGINHLAAFASMAAEDAEYLDELAGAAYARLLQAPGKLDAPGLRALPRALRRRVLAQLLLDAGARVDRAALARALTAVSSSGRATLSHGFEIRSAGGIVRCVSTAPAAPLEPSRSLSGGWLNDPASGLRIGLADHLPAGLKCDSLEIGAAPLPLSIRRRRPGDRVGLARESGRAKLQDVMVNLGIPSEERDSIPVVCDAAGRILWVIGVWPRTPRLGLPGGIDPGVSGGAGATRYLLAERISAPASANLPRSL
jgi:tRNA(Ile)-lysidine synthase